MVADPLVTTRFQPYRGSDRRRVALAADSVPRRPLIAAAAAVSVLWVVVAVGVPRVDGHELLSVSFDVAASILALTVGGLVLARSRWTGETASFWMGLGFCALGAFRLVFWMIVPFIDSALSTAELSGVLRLVGRTIALGAFLIALLGPDVDAGPKMRQTVLLVTLPIAAGILLFLFVPGGLELFGEDSEVFFVPLRSTLQFGVAALLGWTWVALAATYLVSGFRSGRPMVAWFGLSFAALSMGQMLSLPATLAPQLPVLSAAILRSAAFVCALIGIVAEMRRLYAAQGAVIQQASAAADEAHARIRSTEEIRQRERHDARNAVHMITTAVHTLERYQDALTAEDRQQLERAIQQGIDRLRSVLASDSPVDHGVGDN